MTYTNIIKFETRKRNTYLYDGNTSNVVPVDDTILRAIDLFVEDVDDEKVSRTLKSEGYDVDKIENAVSVVSKYKKLGYFYKDDEAESEKRRYQFEFENKHIEMLYDGGNTYQLVLNVTEDCNLRCKYCYLSEVYDYSRNRTSCRMNFETAKVAIDSFMERIRRICRFNPAKQAAITFYGGEPLLNFELIKEVISYVEKEYSDLDLKYNLTTNGVMLTEEKADYLVDKNVILSVSLDGCKINHDRNRVFPDGSGSFDIVYKNIVNFKKRYPDYRNIKLIVVQEYNTNLEENVRFFNDNQNAIPEVVMVNFVTSTNTHFFDNLSEDIVKDYFHSYGRLIQEYLDCVISGQKVNSYLDMFFAAGIYTTLGRTRVDDVKVPMLPFTGSCVPGMKISVRTDGTYDICERVNGTMPIGNINSGIDLDEVSKIIRQYNREVTVDCYKCPISRNCQVCFANCNGCGNFNRPDCVTQINALIFNLSLFYSIIEENPSLKNKFSLDSLMQIEWLLNN